MIPVGLSAAHETFDAFRRHWEPRLPSFDLGDLGEIDGALAVFLASVEQFRAAVRREIARQP